MRPNDYTKNISEAIFSPGWIPKTQPRVESSRYNKNDNLRTKIEEKEMSQKGNRLDSFRHSQVSTAGSRNKPKLQTLNQGSPFAQTSKMKVDLIDHKLRPLADKPASSNYLDGLRRSQAHIGKLKQAKCLQLKKEIAFEREQKKKLRAELDKLKSELSSNVDQKIPMKTLN